MMMKQQTQIRVEQLQDLLGRNSIQENQDLGKVRQNTSPNVPFVRKQIETQTTQHTSADL